MEGKLVIFSAPSGSGKTTIVKQLLESDLKLEFSISACTRDPRYGETDKKDYYFLTVNEFKEKIRNQEFVEWEEVYNDQFYGTLKSELERIWKDEKHVVFDIDVMGGINLKKIFGQKALSVFIKVPSVDELEKRLRKRGADNEESIKKRLKKANKELSFADQFDIIIINDNLDTAIEQTYNIVKSFLENEN